MKVDGFNVLGGTLKTLGADTTGAAFLFDVADSDGDGIPDFTDPDDDNDGLTDDVDNCPLDPNPLQENNDGDAAGDACDADDDNDGIGDALDIVPFVASNFIPCVGAGAYTFTEVVGGDLTCAANTSITVILPAEVQLPGNLVLIAPVVIFNPGAGIIKIIGSMTVIPEDPCQGCP